MLPYTLVAQSFKQMDVREGQIEKGNHQVLTKKNNHKFHEMLLLKMQIIRVIADVRTTYDSAVRLLCILK